MGMLDKGDEEYDRKNDDIGDSSGNITMGATGHEAG